MNNDKWAFGVGGLVLGLLLAGFFASFAVNNNRGGMMKMMGIRGNMMGNYGTDDSYRMHGAMEDMMAGLEDKTGDEFDEAFIEEMIEHHQGAISMATSALTSAKHQEIKDLAKAIIEAQAKEISQMQAWLQAWYK